MNRKERVAARCRLGEMRKEEWEVYDGPGAPVPFRPYTNRYGRGATKPGIWVRTVGSEGQGWCIGITYAPFIAHARQDIPAALDELDRRDELNKKILERLVAGDIEGAKRLLRYEMPELGAGVKRV